MQTLQIQTGDVISFGQFNFIGCSNAAGDDIYLLVPLNKEVTSAKNATFTGTVNWVRANGNSITTGLSVKSCGLARPNILWLTVAGTFSPMSIYAVQLLNAVFTVQ